MSGTWQQAVRPAIVRELLRPLLLARDVERGWLGELLGRAAWPELLYPMLAAWNAQWSGGEDDTPDAHPIVHARPLVHETTIERRAPLPAVAPRKTAAPPVAAPPHVQARRVGEATLAAKRDAAAGPGERLVLETRATIEAPPATRPADRPLPRVVAAFRKNLSESAGRPPTRREAPPSPAPLDLAAASRPTDAHPVVEPRTPLTGPESPLAHPPTPPVTPPPRPAPGDMAPRVQPSAPSAAPSQGPVPGDISLVRPPGPAVAPSPRPVPGDIPLVHPPEPAVSPSPRPVPGDIPLVHPPEPAVTPSPRPVPGDIPLVHARTPDASPHPTSSPARRIGTPADPSVPVSPTSPRPRVTARPRPVTTLVPARTGERTTRPVPARWVGEPGHALGAAPPRRAAARSPRTSEWGHPHPVTTQPTQERPQLAGGPARQPVPSVSQPPAPQPAAAPALDVDSLVKTVEQRLAREFARARELRRALR